MHCLKFLGDWAVSMLCELIVCRASKNSRPFIPIVRGLRLNGAGVVLARTVRGLKPELPASRLTAILKC